MGPTASGKTDLAVELREALGGELISVDSALVYRGMDVGTAKPDAQVLRRAPHRLIDICDPAESYSAADFCSDARAAMAEIAANDRVPILVGGTMMYFNALVQGMATMPPADPTVRERLEMRLEAEGAQALHHELARVDREAAERMHPNNRQRLIRALEVHELTGKPISAFWTHAGVEPDQALADFPYRVTPLALSPGDRKLLHERIRVRFHSMLEQGFIEEVRDLRARGDLSPELPSMRCVGYRQIWDYLEGKTGYTEMIERGLAATRQLAKRQLTWLRRWKQAQWLDTAEQVPVDAALKILDGTATFKP